MVSNPVTRIRRWIDEHVPNLPEDPSHPAHIALRTYALSVSLSLGPALVPVVASFVSPSRKEQGSSRKHVLLSVLKKELGINGFAFAITLAVGGGSAVQHFWRILEESNDWPWDTFFSLSALLNIPGSSEMSPGTNVFRRTFIKLRSWLASLNLSPLHKAFISNIISSSLAIILLQSGRRRARSPNVVAIPLTVPVSETTLSGRRTSPTIDLTLLLSIRAADAVVLSEVWHRANSYRQKWEINTRDVFGKALGSKETQREMHRKTTDEEEAEQRRSRVISRIDAFMFWLSSARIMWCFFYEPYRLPKSYVKWIAALANLDPHISQALRAIRVRALSYHSGSSSDTRLLRNYTQSIGLSPSQGDPSILPAYGGPAADSVWKALGVTSRRGVGGLPCEIIHAGVEGKMGIIESCTLNAGVRFGRAFLEAIMIYFPAHFVPILFTRPRTLLRHNRLFTTILSALRSATFLSSFVASYWYTVCFTRTLVLAKYFPQISHDFWDGPYGCIFAGCLACGSSIWIENGRRRGEMALYVQPRALRTVLPEKWLTGGSNRVKLVERFAFILSLSWLLTAAAHRPDSLRGLSRWTLAFVTKGPNAGFWERKRETSVPQTPSYPHTSTVTARNFSNGSTIP